MDLRTWKKVLLQWVTECGFMEANYITLEQSDMEAFFAVYTQQAEIHEKVQLALQAQPRSPQKRKANALQAFIREIYPEFNAHVDGRGHLVSSEYLYVYTLLLHYTCVKRPSEFFHSICKKLPDVTQNCIASFFQQTMDHPQLTREGLRQAIANVASTNPSRRLTSCSQFSPNGSDGSSGHNSSLGDDNAEIAGREAFSSQSSSASPQPPASTPVHREHKRDRAQRVASNDIGEMPAPPTPKTELLELRTRELLGLRAQLETERYEKNVLEEQIMENEHLINSLSTENKLKKVQLAKLKATVKNEEEDKAMRNYVPNEFDHLKRSLMKEISRKEAIIADTNDKLQDLRTEKSELDNKVKLSSEQLLVCMDRIQELEVRLDEVTQTLSTKDNTIGSLERDKQELEQCLQEARDELHNRREVLNASSDLLDCSLSPNTTPENLASSVIDKQLREKEQENTVLREEISRMSASLQQMSSALSDTLQQYSLQPKIVVEENFARLQAGIQILGTSYVAEMGRAETLKDMYDQQSKVHVKLLDEVQETNRLFEAQTDELETLRCMCSDFEHNSLEMWHKYMKELSDVREDYEQQLCCQKNSHLELIQRCEELDEQVSQSDEHLEQMRQKLEEKDQQFAQLGDKIQDLHERNKQLETRSISMQRLQDHMRFKYTNCQGQLMARNTDIRRLADCLDTSDWNSTLVRIDEVIAAKQQLTEQHETLQQDHLKTLQQVEELKRRLHSSEEQQQEQQLSHRTQLEALQKQLEEAIERYDTLRQRNDDFISQVQADLVKREEELKEEMRQKEVVMAERLQSAVQERDDFLSRLTMQLTNSESSARTSSRASPSPLPLQSDSSTTVSAQPLELKEVEALLVEVLENQNQQLENLKARTEQLESEQLEREEHVRTLTDSTAMQSSELEVKNAKVAATQEKYEKERSKAEELEAQLRAAKKQLEAEQERHENDQWASDQTGHMVKRLHDAIYNLEETNQKLDSDYTKLQVLHSEMEESLAKSDEQIKSLTVELEEAKPKLTQLKETNDEVAARLVELENENLELQVALRVKETQVAKMETAHANKMKSVQEELQAGIDKKAEELEESYAEQRKQAQLDFEAQLKEEHEKLTKVEEQHSEEMGKLKTDLEKQFAAKKEKSASSEVALESQLKRAKAELGETNREMMKLILEHEQEMKQANKSGGQDKDTLAQLSAVKAQLLESKSEITKLIATHANEMKKLNQEHDLELKQVKDSGSHDQEQEHFAQLSTVKAQLLESKSEITKLIATHANEMKKLNQEHDLELKQVKDSGSHDQEQEHFAQLSTVKAQLAESKSEIKKLIVNHQEELSQVRFQLDEISVEAAQKDDDIAELKAQLVQVEEKVDSLSSQLAEDTKRFEDSMSEEIKVAQEEIEKLKEQLAQAEEKEKQLETSKGQLGEQDVEQILEQLAQDEQRLKNLEETNKQEKDQAQQKIAKLQEQLVQSEKKAEERVKQLESSWEHEKQIAQHKIQMLSDQLPILQKKLDEEHQLTEKLKADLSKQEQELRKTKTQLANDTKRLEKLAVTLGETQADLSRHQRELAQAKAQAQTQEQHAELAVSLKRENEAVQRELHLAKERMVRAEREHQLKLATLEDQLETLLKARTQSELDRASAHDRIAKLEKLRDAQESELRELNEQLAEADQVKVRLNLEIGALNSNIELRRQRLADQSEQVCELQQRLLAQMSERQLDKERLAQLQDQLAAVQQELDGSRLIQKALHIELEEKVQEMEQERAESAERVKRSQRRIEQVQMELSETRNQMLVLQQQRESRNPSPDLGATYSKSDAPDEDAARNSKLELDCQILQAKYREAKEEIQRCEQKIKDQRLEMEGKLDKMKNKMRSLYTAEVIRMKEKQEREAAGTKAELEALTAQNAKYEEHTRKLSNQIVRLNEKVLEQQKQNAILSTKLRHLQMPQSHPPAAVSEIRPCSASTITVSTSSTKASDDWQPFKRPNAPSSNLAMEDEEGEVFNNTYLTDLKLGRVPDAMTAEELNYRNSLQPPHLRSAYAAQYDLSSQDEEAKDGPHSLDDSMSALLSSSTSNGARKKSMGTHYKRPGPPTPSKNGGRLSFGSSEPPREILRECRDDHNTTSKTPARFKFLSSRFSVGSSGLPRDEVSSIGILLPQRKRPNLLSGMQRRRLHRLKAAGAFCTSTPRKSRSYYDHHRLIRASDASTPKREVEEVEEIEEVIVKDEEKQQPKEEDQSTPHLPTSELFAMTRGQVRRITGSSSSPAPTHRRKRRISLCLHGNIFAKIGLAAGPKISTPVMAGKRNKHRRKLQQERMARFDEARHLDQVRLSGNLTYALPKDNNNYSLHNRNEELPKDSIISPPLATATFSVEPKESIEIWQMQQEFESKRPANWLSLTREELQSSGLFEQLCQETASTAPFHLQPLVYPEVGHISCGSSNASYSTNQTNMTNRTNATSASSHQSCNVFSLGSIHMQSLPQVNVTYVQRRDGDSRMRRDAGGAPVQDHSLRDRCWRIFGQLGRGKRLLLSLVLLAMVML
ncbi:hypothetical protein KR009_003856, partial [Drosophila setifemur]